MHPVKIATLIAAILGLVACDGDNINPQASATKTLQAEAYSYVEGAVELGDGGTTVQQFNYGEYLYYPSVNFDGFKRITINYASEVENAALEFRLGAPDGELIAFIDLPNTGSRQNFAEAYGDITGAPAGQHALYVLAHNLPGEVVGNLDFFRFSAESSPVQNVQHVIEENTTGFCYAGEFSVEATVESEYEGALGEGYIKSDNLLSPVISWKVNVPETGAYTLRFRYANGSNSPRLGMLVLQAGVQHLNFETTDEWSNWRYLEIKAPLYGGDNFIQLIPEFHNPVVVPAPDEIPTPDTDAGLPNIDSLTIVGADVTPVGCGVEEVRGLGGALGGSISATANAPGWASMNGGTSGGNDVGFGEWTGGSSISELQDLLSGSEPRYILIRGNINGTLRIGSNKTLITNDSYATLTGNIEIVGSSNVIVRNFKIRGEPCDSVDDCKEGPPAIYVGGGASNIWLDHLDIADGQNSNLKVDNDADFVTVSWNKLHYTDSYKHRSPSEIAISDDDTPPAQKTHVTYMNNWWGPGADQDLPRSSYSNIHMLNNYFNTGGNQIHSVGYETSLIAENNYYAEPSYDLFTDLGGAAGWLGSGNEGNAQNMNDEKGSTFYIPYGYTARPASAVKSVVTSSRCGAGDHCGEGL